jgi:hypothetical protein
MLREGCQERCCYWQPYWRQQSHGEADSTVRHFQVPEKYGLVPDGDTLLFGNSCGGSGSGSISLRVLLR